jgi:hypothetical protein
MKDIILSSTGKWYIVAIILERICQKNMNDLIYFTQTLWKHDSLALSGTSICKL